MRLISVAFGTLVLPSGAVAGQNACPFSDTQMLFGAEIVGDARPPIGSDAPPSQCTAGAPLSVEAGVHEGTAPFTGSYRVTVTPLGFSAAVIERLDPHDCSSSLACGQADSVLQFDATAGERIVVAVHVALGANPDQYLLSWTGTPCGDQDQDGVCDADDVCLGNDASGDTDRDGLCDDIDDTCDLADVDTGSALGRFVMRGFVCGGGDDWRPEDPLATCGSPEAGLAEDVLMTWTAPFTGQFGVTTLMNRIPNYDTVLALLDYEDGACGTLACNDNSAGNLESSLVFDATAGQTFVFALDGHDPSACGLYDLAVHHTAAAGLSVDTRVRAGDAVLWSVYGAIPGADLRLYFSRPGASAGNPTPFPGGPSTTLDSPKGVLQTVVPPGGSFTVSATAPSNLPAGLVLSFQAVYWDGTRGGVTPEVIAITR